MLMTLAFVAIVMKVVVPPGYMVATSAAGYGPVVVLCSGHKAYVDALTGKLVYGEPGQPSDSSKGNGNSPCLFAAAAHWGPPAQAQHALVTDIAFQDAPVAIRVAAIGLGAAAPPPWATGPPRSA